MGIHTCIFLVTILAETGTTKVGKKGKTQYHFTLRSVDKTEVIDYLLTEARTLAQKTSFTYGTEHWAPQVSFHMRISHGTGS